MPRPLTFIAIGWVAAAAIGASASEPVVPIAEEILDTAIAHCTQGEFTQAHTLLNALHAQLDPPPGVQQFITSLVSGGCETLWSAPRHWDLRTTLGHDSNINQGVSSSTLTLGNTPTAFEFSLDDTYRPMASAYLEATVSHSQPIRPGGAILHTRAGGRSHTSSGANPYDLAHISVALSHTTPMHGRPVELLAEATHLWLGGRRYHTAAAAAAQAALLPSTPQLKFSISAQALRYHTQPQQDSTQIQLGIAHPLHISQRSSMHLGATSLTDHVRGQRAGGHRKGTRLYATGTTKLPPWRFAGRIGLMNWSSQQHFFPGLINQARRNHLMHLTLQAEYPLNPHQDIQIDLQFRRSRDNIALYAYQSVQLGLSWAARF